MIGRLLLLAPVALLACVPWLPVAAQIQERTERTMAAADGTSFVVTEGFVRVPERWHGAGGGTIELAVVRVRLPDKAGAKVHAILAGGPGASGVGEVLNQARQGGAAWFALMDGEVVGIDQRGAGKSRPNLDSPILYGLPPDRPGSPAAWLPRIRAVAAEEAARLRARGVHLGAYNTEESADDVDAVRRAFGYGKLILWGRSYGTHLALATLRRHPDAIERMILVSPEGLDDTWKSPAAVDEVLGRVAERAAAPELIGNIRSVTGKLAEAPVSVPFVDPVSGARSEIAIGAFDVQLLVAQAIGDPRALAGLPAVFRLMAAGDFHAVGPLILRMRSTLGIQSAMKHAMDLSSGASPGRRARIAKEARTALLGNAINFPGMYLAEAWQVAELPAAFRIPVASAVPTLILVGDLDVRTPVANAEKIAATLSGARTVIVRNAAHQFGLFGSAPLRDLLRRFVRGQEPSEREIALPPPAFQR